TGCSKLPIPFRVWPVYALRAVASICAGLSGFPWRRLYFRPSLLRTGQHRKYGSSVLRDARTSLKPAAILSLGLLFPPTSPISRAHSCSQRPCRGIRGSVFIGQCLCRDLDNKL